MEKIDLYTKARNFFEPWQIPREKVSRKYKVLIIGALATADIFIPLFRLVHMLFLAVDVGVQLYDGKFQENFIGKRPKPSTIPTSVERRTSFVFEGSIVAGSSEERIRKAREEGIRKANEKKITLQEMDSFNQLKKEHHSSSDTNLRTAFTWYNGLLNFNKDEFVSHIDEYKHALKCNEYNLNTKLINEMNSVVSWLEKSVGYIENSGDFKEMRSHMLDRPDALSYREIITSDKLTLKGHFQKILLTQRTKELTQRTKEEQSRKEALEQAVKSFHEQFHMTFPSEIPERFKQISAYETSIILDDCRNASDFYLSVMDFEPPTESIEEFYEQEDLFVSLPENAVSLLENAMKCFKKLYIRTDILKSYDMTDLAIHHFCFANIIQVLGTFTCILKSDFICNVLTDKDQKEIIQMQELLKIMHFLATNRDFYEEKNCLDLYSRIKEHSGHAIAFAEAITKNLSENPSFLKAIDKVPSDFFEFDFEESLRRPTSTNDGPPPPAALALVYNDYDTYAETACKSVFSSRFDIMELLSIIKKYLKETVKVEISRKVKNLVPVRV